MNRIYSLCALFCILFSLTAFADQLTLDNGDRLTGEITKSDGKTLTLKTKYAGTIDIDWKAIQDLRSDKEVFVESSSTKKTYSGIVSTENDKIIVKSAGGSTETISKGDVQSLRSPSEQSAYQREEHPTWSQGWSGGANVGFALAAGNSETKNLALAFTAARKGKDDKLGLYANSVYATDGLSVPSTTANMEQGGVRYDHDFDGFLFTFVGADFMADALQLLNLRSVFSGGIGYHAIRHTNTTLDFLTGANYTREDYTTFSRDVMGLTLGEEFMHKLNGHSVLNQKLGFFPDLTNTGEYRATFDLGTATKINKWFGWQNTFSDIYVTNPPVGKKTNDVLFSTGLSFSFTH